MVVDVLIRISGGGVVEAAGGRGLGSGDMAVDPEGRQHHRQDGHAENGMAQDLQQWVKAGSHGHVGEPDVAGSQPLPTRAGTGCGI